VEENLDITWGRILATVDKYCQDIYANYEYEQVKEKLQVIKDHNPDTEFIVFTTPVSLQLFELIKAEGLFPHYLKWLEDMVEVFGEVHHFMYPNSITTDIKNFYDGSHIYPEIGTLLAHKIISYPNVSIPEDFGLVIDRSNLRPQLTQLARRWGP
jgi:hypothetical protein